MLFDYFYGVEAEQYNFIRLPKLLMTQKEYCDISLESKLLYGLLLDRMSSSGKNKWVDEEELAAFIYHECFVLEIPVKELKQEFPGYEDYIDVTVCYIQQLIDRSKGKH